VTADCATSSTVRNRYDEDDEDDCNPDDHAYPLDIHAGYCARGLFGRSVN